VSFAGNLATDGYILVLFDAQFKVKLPANEQYLIWRVSFTQGDKQEWREDKHM